MIAGLTGLKVSLSTEIKGNIGCRYVYTMTKKLPQYEVLGYSRKQRHRSTVRRHYMDWRKQHNVPLRCDIENCRFFQAPLEWNGQKLDLILDHVDGNNLNNHHNNLRLICPNCDSQLPTKGGKNINRVQNVSESGYQIHHKNGRVDAKAFLSGVEAKGQTGNIKPKLPLHEKT